MAARTKDPVMWVLSDPDETVFSRGDVQFFDEVAGELHDRTVYDILKAQVADIHPTAITALLESLDAHDIALMGRCTDWFEVRVQSKRVQDGRASRAKPKHGTRRLNYPIDEVLDDYVNHRKGKVVEARRQLRKRFDGLDHDRQEAVMLAFMEHGSQTERNFIYAKLYGEEFWTDDYIPLVQRWYEAFPDDGKLAKVIVKYCPREYILSHLEELERRCNYATLCLRTGLTPDPGRLPPWTYLYVLKTSGGQLRFREGEEVVFRWVRRYLYEESADEPVQSLYSIPYVRRMLFYLGEMGRLEDILAIDAFDQRMCSIPSEEWSTSVIKAIEEEFDFPPLTPSS